MPEIVIANSYFYRFDDKQWKTKMPYPPLGTITAASYLKSHGYNISFHDNNLAHSTSELFDTYENLDIDYFIIYDDGFNYLTKMCLSKMKDAAYDMISWAKKKGSTVIVSSSDSTDHFIDYHNQGADIIIHGEGEITLLEVLNTLTDKSSIDHIQGISYQSDSGIKKNSPRSVSKALDDFPMAAWDLINLDNYRNIWAEKDNQFSLNIATTRGCPYKCNWCAKPIYGNRYNTRSPEKVVDEIEYLSSNFGVNHFWMCDDIFGLKPGWVQDFKSELQKRNLSISYKIQSRADLLLKDDNLDALADSGAAEIWIGAESGSQRILDAMDKGTSIKQIYTATKKLRERNVRVAFFIQFGYLTETWSEITETIDMIMELMPDDIGISVSYPLPGTKFYDKVKSDLMLKSNWTDSDDLAMMFENTYPPAFYKILHRSVHNRYRIKKGIQRLTGRSQSNQDSLFKDVARMAYHVPSSIINKLRLQRFL